MTQTHDAGIEPLLILDYGNPLYDGGGFPVSAEGQAAFVRFATFVAQQFKGRVKRYEVWNEWNIGMGTGRYVRGDPVVYANLLKKVYAALKAVDPEIIVLGGAAAGRDTGWAGELFAADALPAMDGYSMHPYVFPDVPEKALEWLSVLETLAKSKSGGRAVPLYVTEIGWPTYLALDGVTRSVQADYLARLYLLAPMYSYLKGIWWYDIGDDGPNPLNRQHNYGLYTSTWFPKPAVCAMTEVRKLQKNYRPVFASRDADGVWVAKYRSDTLGSVFAIWTQEAGAAVNTTVSSSSPSGATISADGICESVTVTGNGSTLLRTTISNSPILFSTAADSIVLQ